MQFSKNLSVFLVTVLFIALGAEVYYRFINPEVLGNTGSLSYQKWAKKNIKVNQWGFRDKERTIKKPEGIDHRVVVIGPSNILGQGVSDLNQRFTERLEKTLNETSDKKFEVMNAGTMTLDNIGTSIKLTQDLIRGGVDFDSIVIYYSWNSIKHIPGIRNKYMEFKKKHYKPKAANPADSFLTKNSYAYDWLKSVSKDKTYLIDGKTYDDWHFDFYRQEKYYQFHIETLRQLNELIAAQGAKLYLNIVPSSYKPEDRAKYQDVLERFMQDMDAKGIAYADASKIYEGIPEMDIPVSKFDGHNKPKFYGDMINILVPVMLKEHDA